METVFSFFLLFTRKLPEPVASASFPVELLYDPGNSKKLRESLDLTHWAVYLKDDEHLYHILRTNSVFTSLTLHGPNTGVDDETLARLWGGCTGACVKLRSIDLKGQDKITDASVKELFRLFGSVKALTLAHCSGITDQSIQAIMARGAALEALDVEGCGRITSIAISAIATKCLSLRRLNLAGCTEITDKALTTIG